MRKSLPLPFRGTSLGIVAWCALGLQGSCTRLEAAGDTFGAGGAVANGGSAEGGAPTGSGGRSNGGMSGANATMSRGGAGGVSAMAGFGGAPASAGGVGGADDCLDSNGFHGLGCGTCPPSDIVSLENACTGATCTPFDNAARLPRLRPDGSLPSLPPLGTGGASGENLGGAGGEGSGLAGAASNGGTSGAGTSGGATATAGASGSSGAGVACTVIAQPRRVFKTTSSSAAKPYLQQVAQQLATQNVSVVYTATGSCVGVDAIVNATPMTTGALPAPAAVATYWDGPSSSGKACDLPPAGVSADLGISDVFAQTCPSFELANLDSLSVRDTHGPIQTMIFATPANSNRLALSAQAAYLVFGFGAESGLVDESGQPLWNDENFIFQRSASSGTQALLGAAIGVPPARFRGKPHKSSDEMAADLQDAGADAASAAKAIGILAADYVDSKNLRAQLRTLAFQDTHQACAVYPDSTATAHDKQNVRDGHYPLWGPLHLLYRVAADGSPANPATRQHVLDVVGYLAGSKALPNGVNLLDVYAQSGLVPECAMRVTRSKDGGNLAPFTASSPCGCSFELKASGATSCRPCNVQGDCAADETCSLGYCER